MVDSHLEVMVLGHSFVARAQKHLLSKGDDNCAMHPGSHNVVLKGKGGAHANDIMPLFHQRSVTPHLVIIDIGTNDLTNHRITTHSLARQVYSTAKHIIQHYGVNQVVILEVLPRTTWGRHGAPASFSGRVARYNAMIRSLVFQNKLDVPVSFWFHQGLASSIETFISDGVHMNNAGLIKYIKSIRRIILKSTRTIMGR